MDIKELILPLSFLPQVYVDDPVTKILSSTHGSHDAVIVIDRDKQYHGVAYSYNMLYKRRINQNATAKNVLFSPPKITVEDSPIDVLRQMISLRLYTLLVFDKTNTPMGVVTAKDIVRKILDNKQNAHTIIETIHLKEPLYVEESAVIKDIYTIMRHKQASRVVVLSKHGTIDGMLTRRDMYLALLSPAPNNRLRNQGGTNPSAFFDRDWVKHFDYPVKTYMSRNILSAEIQELRKEIIHKLLQSDKNSIIITDKQKKPIGMITTRDVLSAIIEHELSDQVYLTVTDKNNILSTFRRQELEEMLRTFSTKLAQRSTVTQIELVVEPVRKSNLTIRQYDVKITITLSNNKLITSKSIQFRLRDAVRDCENKILRQIAY